MINTVSIGKIIQKLRNDKKLTQEGLSEEIGISKNYLSKVERGISKLNVEAFLKMAKVLNFSLNDFGIETPKINPHKTELIDLILSSSDKETEAYLELLKTMNHIVRFLK